MHATTQPALRMNMAIDDDGPLGGNATTDVAIVVPHRGLDTRFAALVE